MERVYGKSFGSLWKILELYSYFLLLMLIKQVDELEPSCEKPVPSQLSIQVRDETMKTWDLPLFHYWVQHFPTWSPLANSVIIFTHIDNLLQVYGNFIILASFDAYKTIKAIEISCRKAFAYSEHIKRKLYRWKKKKFVPKREEHWIIKLLELYCTKKTEHEHESKYKRKVANIILLLWSPTIWIGD